MSEATQFRTGEDNPRYMPLEERLRLRSIEMPSGCWQWTGAKDRSGYGMVKVGRKMTPAHRASYMTFCGPIPPGLEIDHLCRNPLCIRPSHLEPVTHRENVLRGRGKTSANTPLRPRRLTDRTGAQGSAHGMSKLSEADVLLIRERHRHGIAKRALAKAFSVNPTTIRRIVNGQAWTHLASLDLKENEG